MEHGVKPKMAPFGGTMQGTSFGFVRQSVCSQMSDPYGIPTVTENGTIRRRIQLPPIEAPPEQEMGEGPISTFTRSKEKSYSLSMHVNPGFSVAPAGT